MYNNTLARIEMLDRQDQIFVIRPKQKVPIGRLENNPPHVSAVYTSAYHEVENDYQALQAWLERHQISV
jgi:predicted patatin/cPLA2 family phospholipase